MKYITLIPISVAILSIVMMSINERRHKKNLEKIESNHTYWQEKLLKIRAEVK